MVLEGDSGDDVGGPITPTEVSVGESGRNASFSELQREINSGYGDVLLEGNIVRTSEDDVILISSKVVHIYTNVNAKIDANNLGGIFKIEKTGTLMLDGITLVNSNGQVAYNEGTISFTGCTIANNAADGCNGIVYNGGTLSSTSHTVFENNRATNGGVIYNNGTFRMFSSNIFINNSAVNGGVIYNEASSLTISGHQSFENNSAIKKGGAIFTKGNLTVTTASNLFSIFTGNSAEYGGAIYSNKLLTINSCQFISNNATYGAAIAVEDAGLSISGSTFTQNEATGSGAVYIKNSPYSITNSNFTENKAKSGGALYLEGANSSGSTFENNVFKSNEAEQGAAICLSEGVGMTLSDCEFINNIATSGAIYTVDGKVTISDSKFTDNTATSEGAAIYTEGELEIINTLFDNNTMLQYIL